MKKFFEKMTNGSVKLVERFLPDPYIFAVILTFVVIVAALLVTNIPFIGIVEAWYGGFWSLLTFTMQMALVLVTGTILATAPLFKKGLGYLAGIPKNKVSAILLVSVISLAASYINWGFGLVIGAIFAKEVAKRVKGLDYALLVATAYAGFLIWHAGLSGSIPLALATPGAALATQTGGVVTDPISTALTIFSSTNLIIVIAIFVTLPFLMVLMHPKGDKVKSVDPALLVEEPMPAPKPKKDMTPAEKLENSVILNYVIAALGILYIIVFFAKGGTLNLNIVIFIFLFLAIALHGTPIKTVQAVNSAAKSVGGIILQFPFYAGIMGIMTAKNVENVSLASAISNLFVNISNETTFPLFSFLSAGFLNVFIPSGGGQWAVQGPIMMPAGMALGVVAAKTAMTIAWGDAWTNMIQPFWALPVLGIAKLSAKNIMGYCLIVTLYSGIIIGLGFLLF
jgi:short-chain fatty acids transporter